MERGLLEPYLEGFLELYPDEEALWWRIAALHMSDGEVFEPSPRIYSDQALALIGAKSLYDWVSAHPLEMNLWGAFTPDRNTLKRNWDKYERSGLPYVVSVDDGTLTVICPSTEAMTALWLEAEEIDSDSKI